MKLSKEVANVGVTVYVGMKLSKEVANVGVTVHVQQWLNGPHGTPVHDFLSVA